VRNFRKGIEELVEVVADALEAGSPPPAADTPPDGQP
jgi:hypothetical protein